MSTVWENRIRCCRFSATNGSSLRTAANHAQLYPQPSSAGVNLGGWLLLEPGPSYPLFTHHLLKDKSQARWPPKRVSPWLISALLSGWHAWFASALGVPLVRLEPLVDHGFLAVGMITRIANLVSSRLTGLIGLA